MHFYLLLLIVLVCNYFYRLQSIISEIFVVIVLIISVIYSPVCISFNDEFVTRIFSIKNYLLSQFFPDIPKKYEYLDSMVEHEKILKNYLFYQKYEMQGVVHKYVVSRFDNTFKKILSHDEVVIAYDIENLLNQYPILKILRFGQMISLVTIKNNSLQSLLWQISDRESRIYNRIYSTNSYMENIILKFDVSDLYYYVVIIGRLHDNFINSARSLGLDNNSIEIIVHALQWQVDFHKLHFGDQFSVLMRCSKYSKNDMTDMDQFMVIAARLRSFGRDYYAFRAKNDRFYNIDAIKSVDSHFMRFPTVKPFRVSSNFNLNRLNPVTGRISPHFGVDFAVPIGTPVLSIGDGEVIISKYGQLSGNYIVIRHNTHCITRYMHLKRLLVRPGQMVKRGENIALSGNTGRSTGPHLHFEIWINHKPVNPLTIMCLGFEQLSGSERMNYIDSINKILPYLNFG